MKFFKGMLVGTVVSTGVMMMCMDNASAKRMVKRGKQLIRRIGNN